MKVKTRVLTKREIRKLTRKVHKVRKRIEKERRKEGKNVS